MSEIERGSPPPSPEKLAEFYRIEPYNQTREEIKRDYFDRKFNLKWVFDQNNWNIKIWSYSALNPIDHVQVDRENWSDGYYGEVDPYMREGEVNVTFSNPSFRQWKKDEKEPFRIAIKKFLSD